jgi:Flp pilus assembly protein TadD
LATTGRTSEAIGHLSTAVRLNPSDSDAELNWGVCLMLTNNIGEAIPHFDRACQLNPSPAAHLMFGRALLAQRNFEEAARQFRAVLELDDGSSEAHFNLGVALRSLGRSDEANQHFLIARQLEQPN